MLVPRKESNKNLLDDLGMDSSENVNMPFAVFVRILEQVTTPFDSFLHLHSNKFP
jgi:hypothetical protein